MKKRVTENASRISHPIVPTTALPSLDKIGGEEETEQQRQEKKRLGSSTSFLKRPANTLPSSKYNRPKSEFRRLHVEMQKPEEIVARLLEDFGAAPDTRNIDPRELDLGRSVEMERGTKDPDEAEKIAFANLLKDSRFYTNPRRA